MKKIILLVLLFCLAENNYAQIVRTKLTDTTSNWVKKNKVGLDITQITFLNWNAGGNTSVSGLAKGNFTRKYLEGNLMWNNELVIRYGINKQEGQDARKTDDQLLLNSTFGYRTDTISNWFYGAKFSFNTQFANGYAYPNTDLAISKPFAPAYVFLGIGANHTRDDLNLDIYMSPLTQKTTLVLDERLANQGAYGVTKAEYDAFGNLIRKGKNIRTEIGALISGKWGRTIFENIDMENRVTFYSDYLNNFGNIDVDWQLQLEMTVNKYVKANISTHLIYDDDIKTKEDVAGVQVTKGPKVQLKQILGIGLAYTF
ncbi:DUF3078 domain-containing protein [Flavobacterium sp.]|jgi:hypothetical protein|uniref:DUF3078 domain-containing protein n=1 Tax=Flavobacterium sp. TaxID=239 RepID=UPI002A81D4D0|nr:DUF3078 domain-containing protein [Flavobacterium sp.]